MRVVERILEQQGLEEEEVQRDRKDLSEESNICCVNSFKRDGGIHILKDKQVLQHLTETVEKAKMEQNDNGAKKVVLISGSPGIGKSTSAKLVIQMLGFQA
ncbi:hypothetical protein C5167_027100 [Papaver somniferum]|nr:hypothetical protein C5167_027100 [Papaver somniferum]